MGDAPVAGRLRRPRLLIGLLLIAISVTAVGAVVRSADDTSPYFAVRSTVTPGTVIGPDDVRVVHVRLEGGDYVAASEKPWGKVVTRVVGKGELLPAAALAPAEGFDARTVAVRTALPLADGIGAGSVVDVYLTSDATGSNSTSPTTRAVARGLTVESVAHDGGSFSGAKIETVYVVVPASGIEGLLDALASGGEISVVGLAGGGA